MPPEGGSGRDRASHRAGSKSDPLRSSSPEIEQSNQSMDVDPDDNEHARVLGFLIACSGMEIVLSNFVYKLGLKSPPC